MIAKTIPLVNSEAYGYQREKLSWQFADLEQDSRGSVVTWSEKDRLAELLNQ